MERFLRYRQIYDAPRETPEKQAKNRNFPNVKDAKSQDGRQLW